MSTFKRLASFVLAATMVSALTAEIRCPGNVAQEMSPVNPSVS
jgi:hypothetical protein